MLLYSLKTGFWNIKIRKKKIIEPQRNVKMFLGTKLSFNIAFFEYYFDYTICFIFKGILSEPSAVRNGGVFVTSVQVNDR